MDRSALQRVPCFLPVLYHQLIPSAGAPLLIWRLALQQPQVPTAASGTQSIVGPADMWLGRNGGRALHASRPPVPCSFYFPGKHPTSYLRTTYYHRFSPDSMDLRASLYFLLSIQPSSLPTSLWTSSTSWVARSFMVLLVRFSLGCGLPEGRTLACSL